MDWNSILTLINGADTLLGIAILLLAARYGYRAGRSWLTRRWLRKRLESYEAEDKSEPRTLEREPTTTHEWREGSRVTTLTHPFWDDCSHCPQPTSQQPSESTTGRGTGQSGPHIASPATIHRLLDAPENED